MTRQEALEWLEQAEAAPVGSVDETEWAEAVQALTEPGPISAQPDVVRARALGQRERFTPSIGAGTLPTVTGEEVEVPEVDDEFARRFFEAAEAAGVPDDQARGLLNATVQQVAAFGGNPETLLEPQIAVWLEEAAAARGRPIGVAPDFVATRQQPSPVPASFGDAGLARTVGVDPRYFEGDEFSPAGLSPDEIAGIQTRLEDAGLLEPGDYWAGTWDTLTAQAYKGVLGMANASGRTADTQLEQLIATLPQSIREQRARATAAETFRAPPYIAPDPDSLAQQVKAVFRQALGREPTPQDLAWGIQGLGADYRRQYESQVAAARAEFDAAKGAGAPGATVPGVDPGASFREQLEERFGPEIDRLAALPQVRDNMSNVFASIRTMGNLVGS